MSVRKLWLFDILILTLLIGCSSDKRPQNFSYLRSPAYFKADTSAAETDLCKDFSPDFASEAECRQTKKYRLSWLRPEDTTKFSGYRIYVDTLSPNAPEVKTWAKVQGDSRLASIIVERIPLADEIVFVFGKTGSQFKQDTLRKDTKKIIVIDTTLRQDRLSGKLVFALVPVYTGDVTPGEPKLSWFIVNDRFPPDIFSPNIRVLAQEINLAWARPTDPMSFFDATLDTGLIRNYRLKVGLGGNLTSARREAFAPKLKFFLGDKDVSEFVKDSIISDAKDLAHLYFLPDSNRAIKTLPTLKDSLKVKVQNLKPQDTLEIKVWAVDSSGNSNENAMQNYVVHLTDTTQPSMPKIIVDTTKITANGFIIKWQAARDSLVEASGLKTIGDSDNYLIGEYRLQRTLVRDSGEKISLLDQVDSTILITDKNRKDSIFVDTVKFLPPGRKFHLRLSAVDITGFESQIDTLTITTKPIRFMDSDSNLVCPAGFVPIPRSIFALGDAQSKLPSDELPSRTIKMAPFCIEAYEHRDQTGKFINNVSWQQADSICQNLGLDSAAYQSKLCSEAEWERACEGPGIGKDSALVHGILSEQKNAGILQSSCNQGTNDSVMARSFDLRNATCITGEGVYDMAGNYSEWVRDPYLEKAYTAMPAGDSLNHGFTFADTAKGSTTSFFKQSFRGGNFLKPPNLATSTVQALARCSNRDFAQQIRPIFRNECKDAELEKIAVIYGPGIEGHFCMDIPDSIKQEGKIADLQPRDSTLLVFFVGKTAPKKLSIKYPDGDTLLRRRKPLSSSLTKVSLAAVEFINPGTNSIIPDTLDAKEMRDTSQANLAKIFARESGNSGWSVKKVDGKFAIKYLYAYTYIGTRPAQANYTSRAIGFRCCTQPKTP